MKKQTRDLPKFQIHGTDFYVDVDKNEFRQVDNEANRIQLHRMTNLGPHFLLLYDLQALNAVSGATTVENLRQVIVPSMDKLDPIGYARKHRLPDDTFIEKAERKVKMHR